MIETLSTHIAHQCDDNSRTIIAIAGAPGSGKSTLSQNIAEHIDQNISTHLAHTSKQQLKVQVVPMDGYHFDNAILEQLKLRARKGSPETFDVNGLADVLKRLKHSYLSEDIAIPVFDRDNDLSRGSARLISRDTNVLLVEGNYLLLEQNPWDSLAPYFDYTIMLDCDLAELKSRLMKRWLDLDFSESAAAEKVASNDLINAKTVIKHSRKADYVYRSQ